MQSLNNYQDNEHKSVCDNMHGQHDRIEGENLRFRILLPFILALALILGSFVFGVYQLQQREIHLQTSDHLKISSEIFARQLVEEATNLSSIINVLNQDKDLQAAWSERDRSAIRLKLMPIFEQLASENQLTQLYLHDVDRVNFIRIHKTQRTEKFGDVVNRHTLIEAERTGQPYFGVELGSMGIFTLRVVHPWIIDGELVGYIELGNEIGHISQEIHEDLSVDFIVTIYKFFLIRDRWERGLQMLGREGHWEQLPNMVVIDKTVTQIPPDLKKLLGAEKRVYLEPISKVTIAGRKYGVGMFPLKDVARGYVGEMVVLYDITERVAALRSSILVIGGICFLVGVILFLLFYTILGRTERMLIESRKKLLKEGQVREAEQVRHLEELEREHTALLASEFRFRDIALSTSDWLWEVDAQGIYTFCSEKIEQVLGYGPQEVVGKTPFDLMLPEEAEKIRHQFQKIIAAKAPIIDLENWNSHKNGHTVCLLTNGVPLLDAQGNLIGYRGADKDITDRKLAEREKERLETQLRQAQKMEAIGTLAGGIAHDFNNILAAMLGYADMAEKEIPEGNSAREDLEAVLEAGNRAKDLVKQILAFSRQTEHKSQPIQIRPVVKEVLKLLRASLPSTIEIHEDINENCGAVMGDPTQIHQVLMNLCSNALYAMREKGGVLEVRLDAVNVNVEQAQANPNLSEGPYVVLTVRDTGHGMNASTLERIFEPFYTKKPVGEGTGMGLSTTHGIVKSHNGAMMVTSELGKGSTFQVYLPMLEIKASEEVKVKMVIPRGSESILYVDDEEALANLGQKMLKNLGYSVTARTSSIEALEAFRAHPDRFDLVVTDQTMPNMTGIELATEVMHIRPDMPVILVTGFSETVTPEKAKQLGIRDYILKPIMMAELGKAVRHTLDNKKREKKKTEKIFDISSVPVEIDSEPSY